MQLRELVDQMFERYTRSQAECLSADEYFTMKKQLPLLRSGPCKCRWILGAAIIHDSNRQTYKYVGVTSTFLFHSFLS